MVFPVYTLLPYKLFVSCSIINLTMQFAYSFKHSKVFIKGLKVCNMPMIERNKLIAGPWYWKLIHCAMEVPHCILGVPLVLEAHSWCYGSTSLYIGCSLMHYDNPCCKYYRKDNVCSVLSSFICFAGSKCTFPRLYSGT